jgi:hypothetical protein
MKKLIACEITSASNMKPISWPTRLLVQKQRDQRQRMPVMSGSLPP